MSANSKIEWTDHTFNPWEGCQKVGPGCDHCYAETRNARFGGGVAVNWGPGAPRRRTSASNWALPMRWNAQAEAFMAQHGRRQRVFCASLADVFDNAVDPAWRVDLFKLIAATPNLDWLLLTKRIGNAFEMIAEATAAQTAVDPGRDITHNIWIGATVVNEEEADRDIPKLLAVPARVRFLSMEPLLGDVDLTPHLWGRPQPCSDCPKDADCECGYTRRGFFTTDPKLDWVIVGGESGPGARPMHPDWVRSLRDQCAGAAVPFLFKQWGEWVPRGPESMGYPMVEGVPRIRLTDLGEDGSDLGAEGDNHVWMHRAGKKVAGRLLDGMEWNGAPS